MVWKKLSFPSFLNQVQIVVVDDKSSDKGKDVVKGYITKSEFEISLIVHEKNTGKGGAVRSGIEFSDGDLILVQDADIELDPGDIPKMLKVMHDLDMDFINGSRYMAGISRPLSSFKRYMGNRLFTLLTSWIINVKISDVACGYKLFKRDLLSQFVLRENRFGFEAELIIKAMRISKFKIAEVPVQYFPRTVSQGKKLRNMDGIKILFVIIKYGLFKAK
ncbi:MAG: glycosyltransferase family 2 protein [Bacteroidota bacterium]|nr:glycosyltransferase family 2 protein [Bacteroidota bacterium]